MLVRVIAEDRAGAVVGWRLAEAGAAQRRLAGVIGERQPAAGAVRRAEEGDAAPAGGAKLPLAADAGAAGETARRQQQVEQTDR